MPLNTAPHIDATLARIETALGRIAAALQPVALSECVAEATAASGIERVDAVVFEGDPDAAPASHFLQALSKACLAPDRFLRVSRTDAERVLVEVYSVPTQASAGHNSD